jgi:hypothetical protein
MAHFAQLDENNVVLQVIVVNNEIVNNLPFSESEPIGVAFCQSIYGAGTVWKQTSYNGNFRKNYAGIGFTYRSDLDAFVPPQSYPSWVFNQETANWEPPVPRPETTEAYDWNEETVSWVIL